MEQDPTKNSPHHRRSQIPEKYREEFENLQRYQESEEGLEKSKSMVPGVTAKIDEIIGDSPEVLIGTKSSSVDRYFVVPSEIENMPDVSLKVRLSREITYSIDEIVKRRLEIEGLNRTLCIQGGEAYIEQQVESGRGSFGSERQEIVRKPVLIGDMSGFEAVLNHIQKLQGSNSK